MPFYNVENFENPVPVFEIGKDSYILKHKLNYNTSCGGNFSGVTNKILFTDYNLARKSQSKNSENFDDIYINLDLSNCSFMKFTYYDKTYTLGLYNRLIFSESGTTSTIVNHNEYEQYYIDPSLTPLIEVGSYFNIYFHNIEFTSGTTQWEHIGPAGEYWIKTGTTENNIDWQVTGITIQDGYNEGNATWYVDDYTPILKYRSRVIEVDTKYIKLEKKLQDYQYNNFLNNYDNLYYVLESIDFITPTYHSIKYAFGESIWGEYFDFVSTDNDLTIKPIQNKNDIYFDYDNVNFNMYHTGGTESYRFNTDCLYTKYKLDRFFEQFELDRDHVINYNYVAESTSQPYNGDFNFDIELINSGDTQYFIPYTYINVQVNDLSGNTYICLLTEISGSTLTIVPSIKMANGDVIININNLYTIGDISDMLYECFINIEGDVDDIEEVFYIGNFYDPNEVGFNVIEANNPSAWVFNPIT